MSGRTRISEAEHAALSALLAEVTLDRDRWREAAVYEGNCAELEYLMLVESGWAPGDRFPWDKPDPGPTHEGRPAVRSFP
jgi:hypothetical protein